MMDLGLVAVCGAGAMGSGIAQVAAQAGHSVVVFDTSDAALARGLTAVETSLAGLIKRGRLSSAAAEAFARKIAWTTRIEDIGDAVLVIEAIIEDADSKAKLFDRIEAVVAETAILATNTSSLAVSGLAAVRAVPGRFLGLHFFNPAPVMKLVEVIRGVATEPAVVDEAMRLMGAWGKSAICVRDVPGFIVNRVARPYYAEGFRALGEGVARPEVLDALFRKAAGFRMGPLELADLIGQDINFAVARSVHDACFGTPRFAPQPAQGALVEAGLLGRKSGRGVYDYRIGGAPTVDGPGESETPGHIVIGAEVDPVLASLVVAAGGIPGGIPSNCIEADGVLVAISDGRLAATWAEQHGKPVVLLDWSARDSESCGFAVSAAAALPVARGLLAAIGREALELADRPGLIILRTLGQVANAAGDAVRDRVAEPAEIDQAMRLGANYPVGPLAWAESYGYARLIRTMENIAGETGEVIYQPSEYFRRRP